MNELEVIYAQLSIEDYVSLYEFYAAIQTFSKLPNNKVIDLLNLKLDEIKSIIPIELYTSEEFLGEKMPVPWKKVQLSDVILDNGEPAGVPFYFFSLKFGVSEMEAMKLLDSASKEHS